VERRVSNLQSTEELPKLLARKSRNSNSKAANKEEMFKGLVAFINHSKSKGVQIDSVVDKWVSMSKY